MRNGRIGQHPMPKIKDQRSGAKIFQDRVHRAVKSFPSRQEHKRIEIALNRAVSLDLSAGEYGVDRPVEADRIDRHGRNVTRQPCPCPAWKADESG
jgi:hypothetical protein